MNIALKKSKWLRVETMSYHVKVFPQFMQQRDEVLTTFKQSILLFPPQATDGSGSKKQLGSLL